MLNKETHDKVSVIITKATRRSLDTLVVRERRSLSQVCSMILEKYLEVHELDLDTEKQSTEDKKIFD